MENKIDWSRTDGLIFDMDGTLWDAVDTYARIWNEVFLRAGKEVHITRESLIGNIGIPIPKILANLFPEIENEEANRFSKELAEHEPELLSRYGGTPYPGVVSGLEQLSSKYKLFLVSNCDTHTLPIFMSCIGITPFTERKISSATPPLYGRYRSRRAGNSSGRTTVRICPLRIRTYRRL